MHETVRVTVRKESGYERFEAVADFPSRPRKMRKMSFVALKYKIAGLRHVEPKCVSVYQLRRARRVA
jgi:hypothetical protein